MNFLIFLLIDTICCVCEVLPKFKRKPTVCPLVCRLLHISYKMQPSFFLYNSIQFFLSIKKELYCKTRTRETRKNVPTSMHVQRWSAVSSTSVKFRDFFCTSVVNWLRSHPMWTELKILSLFRTQNYVRWLVTKWSDIIRYWTDRLIRFIFRTCKFRR